VIKVSPFIFVAGGAILVLTGLLQLAVRPRKPGEHRWLNRGTLWAGFLIVVGLGVAVSAATGLLPLGSADGTPPTDV
jgi:hypothetical protein